MARVSIRGVAERAGVSTMTVSRVLRGEGDSQYYDQVMAAVRELDYVPVRSALQNRHVKTNSIGVLLDGAFVFENVVGFRTFAGISGAAFANSHDLVLLQPKGHRPLTEQKMQVLDRRCDGFIFVVPYERPEVLELLVKHEFPAVACYSTDVPVGIYSVVPDNRTAVHQAVELLHASGHTNIAFWSAGHEHSDARERSAAYMMAMQGLGLKPLARDFECFENRVPINVDETLNFLIRRGITAVICHNDERALSLWDTAVERGLSIPEDLSLIGIDDLPAARERGLTTFENPFRLIGQEATETLLSLLHGVEPPERSKRLPMPLKARNSVAAPKIKADKY